MKYHSINAIKAKKRKMFILLTLFAFFSSACIDTYDDAASNNAPISKLILTPEEYASIAYDVPKELTENEIIDIINDFQSLESQIWNKPITKSSDKSKVSNIKKYYLAYNNDLAKHNTTRSANLSKFDIPIYEVELSKGNSQKDFAIICGDERAPKILFYANDYNISLDKSNIEMKYLMEVAKQSSLADIELIENLKSTKRDSTLNKISKEFNIPLEQITNDFIKTKIKINEDILTREYNPIGGITTPPARIMSMVSPISNIAWHQDEPYNNQMPTGTISIGGWPSEGRYPVGCANIAIATLLSILQPAMVGETASGRQILIDWDYITTNRSLNYLSPAKMLEMSGSLLRAIYNRTKSEPHFIDIKSFDEDNNPYYVKAVMETSTTTLNMLNYIKIWATYSGGTNTKFNPNTVMQSLQNQKPVLLFGNGHFINDNHQPINEPPYNSTPGHGWLIDGYCITRKAGQTSNDLYWSVNMGWGEGTSCIYFKAQNNFQDCDIAFNYDGHANIAYYTQEQFMIFNVEKK